MRPTVQDDDEVTGLPASDGDAAGETGVDALEADPEDAEDDTSEDVGLDAEAGIDEPLDVDLDLKQGEGTSFLLDSEAAEDLATGEDDVGDGEEYGYTDDSEPLNDEGLYEGAIVIGEEGSALEDRGEEGFSDEALAGELDENTGEISPARERPSAPPRASQPVISGIKLGNERIRVEVLQRSGRPLRMLCSAGGYGVAWDGTLLVAGPSDPRPDRRYAGSDAVGALAAMETSRGLEIALITPEALLVSRDGGLTCTTRRDWPDRVPASSIALLRSPSGGVRLLAAAPLSAVYASDDGGRFEALGPESGVVRLGSDNAMSALALIRSEANEPLLALSTDGGATFESIHAPVDALERVQDAQVAGQAVVCCRRAPEPRVLWTQAEGWSEALPEASAPVRVIEERHGAVIYTCLASGERIAIMRRELPRDAHGDSADAGPAELIAELPRDVGGVLQLTGAHEGGITTLHVGTERAWLRITVLPGGSDA